MTQKTSITLLIISVLYTFTATAQYDFKFKVKGIADTTVYLANYYGDKMYYNDTTRIDANGFFEFKGDGDKHGGIYAVIFPDKKSYFEIVVNEPKIELETVFGDFVNSMNVKVSMENKAFYEYMHFVAKAQKEIGGLQKEVEATDDGPEKDKLKAELEKKETEAEKYRVDYLKKYKGLFAAKILETSKDPIVPEFKNDKGELDEDKRFSYYKEHYFDNVDLRDDRLLYTPVLHKKLAFYLEKLTPQVPDSICAGVDYLTSQVDDSSLVFKYIIQFTTNNYEKSQIMGMDAVFVCVAENYYTKGKAWWLDEEQLDEITEMYKVRKNLTIGVKAENIILQDTTGKWESLYDVKAKYTVVIFWDPNCGHCKKEIPKLLKVYHEMRDSGLEVFSVCTEFETKDWIKYVADNKLDWINVSDNPEVNQNATKYITAGLTTLNSLNFRDYWDIFSTPQIYLLDKDKNIIAKRIVSEQIPEFIEKYENRKIN